MGGLVCTVSHEFPRGLNMEKAIHVGLSENVTTCLSVVTFYFWKARH